MKLQIPTKVIFITVILLMGCKQTKTMEVQDYLEFYYPPLGINKEMPYEILFDWGKCVIVTGAGPKAKLSSESEPYRGYIAIRAIKSDSSNLPNFPVYLVTSDGEVWTCESSNDIPRTKTRQELIVEVNGISRSTSTTEITSFVEPVVDHFISHRDLWRRFGKMELNGTTYKLNKTNAQD